MAGTEGAGAKPADARPFVSRRQSAFYRYSIAVAGTGLAALGCAALDPVIQDPLTFPLFFAAIAVAAWFGGAGPGVVSAATGFAAAEWFFAAQVEAWPSLDATHGVSVGLYVSVASAIVLLCHVLQRARANAALLRLAHDAIVMTDQGDRISFWNRGAEQTYGWSSKEALGRNVHDLLQTIFPIPLTEIEAAIRDRGHWMGELTHTTRDGRTVIAESRWSRPRHWSHKHGALLEINRDITGLRASEGREQSGVLALEASERKFKILYEHLNDAFVSVDMAGHLMQFNEAYSQMLAYASEELLSRTYQDLTPAEWHGMEDAIVREQVLTQGYSEVYEKEYRRKDGTKVPVELRTVLVRDESGQPKGMWAIVRDITERKRAEQALRKSEARFRRLYDSGLLGVMFWNMDGAITDANDKFLDMIGYSRQDLAAGSIDWVSLTPPEYRRLDEASVKELMASGVNAAPFEKEYIRKDGSRVPIILAGAMLDDARFDGVAFVLDITDRKRAEDSLREANRKLTQLSTDLLRSQDYERRRIARELHDSTSQLLSALSMNLSRLADPALAAGRRSEALSQAIHLAESCSTEIRTVTYLLHPPLLDQVGLPSALECYTQGFSQRTGIQVEVKISPDLGRLGQDRESALFRIVQEGLANIHRHSGSDLAVVRLDRDAREVRLTIRDRGRGFPATSGQANGFVGFGVGILGMIERAKQLGGTVDLISGDTGATVTAILPLLESNEENSNPTGR